MFQQILAPVDFGSDHQVALTTANQLALAFKGQVTLLHVIEKIQHMSYDENHDFFQKIEEKVGVLFASLQKYFDADVVVQHEITYGRPFKQIALFAEQRSMDLIVLTNPTFQADDSVRGWGSSNQRIALLTTVPVMLVSDSIERGATP